MDRDESIAPAMFEERCKQNDHRSKPVLPYLFKDILDRGGNGEYQMEASLDNDLYFHRQRSLKLFHFAAHFASQI